MIKKNKNLNRPLLGVSELPHYWGQGKFWNQSGGSGERYGYPKPFNAMWNHRIMFGPDAESKTKKGYRYPVLIDNDKFFLNWTHQDFKEALEFQMKAMKWMGVEVLRVHLLLEEMGEEKDFLGWYLDLAKKYGFSMYIDAAHWESLLKWVKKYGDKVNFWQVGNEWVTLYSPVCDVVELRDETKFNYCCERYKAIYEEAKKLNPEACIGVNTWSMSQGKDKDTKAMAELVDILKKKEVKFDFWGIDYYPIFGSGLEEIREELGNVSRRHPGLKIVFSEFGWHLLGGNVHNHSTSTWKENTFCWIKTMEEILQRVSPEARPKAILAFWFQDKPVFRFECFHACLSTTGEPLPMGRLTRDFFKKQLPPDAPINMVDIQASEVIIKNKKEAIKVKVKNTSSSALNGRLILEPPRLFTKGIEELMFSFSLTPGRNAEFLFDFTVPENLPPGVYHFFVRAELDLPGQNNFTYGWAMVRKVAARITFDGKLSPQIPRDIRVQYTNFEELLRFSFVKDADRSPLIIYGKDYGEGGVQMEVACGSYLWECLPFAIGLQVELEEAKRVSPETLASRPIILLGTPSSNKWIEKLVEEGKLNHVNFPDEKDKKTAVVAVAKKAFGSQEALIITANDALALCWATHDFIEKFFRQLKWPLKIFPPCK